MATLTPIDGNLTIDENFTIVEGNTNTLNDAKVESDITQLPPAQQPNAVILSHYLKLILI